MIKIGVTGGIGCGKSIICEILRLHGIPVYDADKEAKKLNDTSPVIRQQLSSLLGSDLYDNNKLDRAKLAKYIFSNRETLLTVNSIIHTELAKHFLNWCSQNSNSEIIAIDAAVLFEAGFQKYVDISITVTAPIDMRIKRVMNRDKLTVDQIKARINSQMNDNDRIKLSHFVIINDNKQSIINQTAKILKILSNRLLH